MIFLPKSKYSFRYSIMLVYGLTYKLIKYFKGKMTQLNFIFYCSYVIFLYKSRIRKEKNMNKVSQQFDYHNDNYDCLKAFLGKMT